MAPSVTITQEGRSGAVRYAEGARAIKGYFEFGAGDVVTIISMGSREEWAHGHPWALPERAHILAFVAEEAIRQRAPTCVAEIQEERGDILLRQPPGAEQKWRAQMEKQAKAAAFVRRFTALKAKLGAAVFAVACMAGALMWFSGKALTVEPASGVPLGEAVRTDTVIASLIQKTDPHLPRWSGRGGDDTTSISLFLIPLDGGRPRLVPVASKLTPNAYQLARIMGADGRTLWFDVAGLYGVRLDTYRLVTTRDLRAANPSLPADWWDDPRGMDVVEGRLRIVRIDRSAALHIDPATLKATPETPHRSTARFERHEPADTLAAGLMFGEAWLGLHSETEASRAFAPGKWVRPVERADEARQMRRLYRATLGDASDGGRRRIRAITPLGDAAYYEAAFLRLDDHSAPLRVADPDSALMAHTSAPGLRGTLVISRVDADGRVLWSTDTGLDRFQLRQILPGAETFAFVGTRLPIPDKLSEPLVVLIDNKTGKATTQSLWR